jgi:hypothetical protein
MKRASWIVGIVLAVAVAVGAFVIGGSDGSSEAKSPNTSVSNDNSTKSAANQISGAIKVQSLPPLKPTATTDDDDDDDDDDQDSYETRKAFVGVSPSRVQAGKDIEVQVRGFKPGEQITVNLGNGKAFTLKADKEGRAKKKVKAPAVGTYLVQATGVTSTRVATTNLKVVKKK